MVLSTLKRIQREQRNASSPNALTRAHRDHLVFIIEKALGSLIKSVEKLWRTEGGNGH
jgi:hypothetical protein